MKVPAPFRFFDLKGGGTSWSLSKLMPSSSSSSSSSRLLSPVGRSVLEGLASMGSEKLWVKSKESEDEVEMLISLRRSRPVEQGSFEGLPFSRAVELREDSLAKLQDTASSMVWSSKAMWQRRPSASSRLVEFLLRDEGTRMGLLNFLGGEDEGDKELKDDPNLDSRLLFSWGVLIQQTVSGMVFCLRRTADLPEAKRGGGGRGGGDLLLLDLLTLECDLNSVLCARQKTLSSLFWWSVLPGDDSCFLGEGLVWCVCRKRGLIKHSAPLDWLHSSSEGVRVNGMAGTLGDNHCFSLCCEISHTVSPDTEDFLVLRSSQSQKSAWRQHNEAPF